MLQTLLNLADALASSTETMGVIVTIAAIAFPLNQLDQRQITAWLGHRNGAAHVSYSDYTEGQVRNMLTAITNFMVRVSL